MDNNAMEEFSVGQMLPVVPINSDQKGNSLSDTSIEEMIDSNNEEFDKESDENKTLTKSINKVFDSLELSTKKEECKDCEEEIPTLLEIDCQQAENFLSEGIIASPFQCYFEITVTANKSWTSTINYNDSQKDWCEYHPASMDITNDMSMSTFTNVRLMIAQNTSGEERSATITITTGDISKSFTIKQKQNDVISLSTDLIKSNSNGGNYQIEVTSNIDYDVQIPTEHQDWVKFSNRTKAISTNNIEFTIAPNLNYDKRECDIYIIPKNGIVTESLAPSLHILQLPKSLIELDKLQETFPKEGGNAIFLLTTNTEYEVVIDKTYSWIKLDKIENAQAKVQKLYISVSETETPRTGVVLIKDKNSDLIQELSITQTNKSASKSVEVQTAGTLFSLIDESEKYQITSLTVSGRLNSNDISFINDLLLKSKGGKGKIIAVDLYNTLIDKSYGTDEEIDKSMFGNTLIKNIILPKYTRSIGWDAFRNCIQLETIQIPSKISYIGASAFNYCTSLKTITFEGNSLTHIDNWAFSDCPIKSIYIPASVIQIGWGAFSCPQLQEIHMLGENPPTVGNSSPFANFNATLYVPKGCATKYWAAPIWGDFKNIVEE